METPLYNQLCNTEVLRDAWLAVKAKKSKGGIDDVSLEKFDLHAEENLQEIVSQLITKTYMAMPMQKISIRKRDGSTRELGMLTVSDKIVQLATKMLIEPVLEKSFLDVSYGFRPKKSPAKAIKRLLHIMNSENRPWIVACDIHNCFDSIPQNLVLKILAKKINDSNIVELVEGWLRMGRVSNSFKWDDSHLGLHQGAILSPLLSNLYLHSFDTKMTSQKIGYLRYADDFIICCKTAKEAKFMLGFAQTYLREKLKLVLNNKSRIYSPTEAFTYLGVTLQKGLVHLSNEKNEILKQSMYDSFGIENNNPSRKFIQKLSGIHSYYGQILLPKDSAKLDVSLIECLKYQLGKSYDNKLLPNKSSIRKFVELLRFFNPNNELINKKIAIEIANSCIRHKKAKSLLKNSTVNRAIKTRKIQFQKMEASGMEILVSSPGMQIGISKGLVTLKKAGKVVKKVKAVNLKNITITSDGVNLSSNLMRYCANNGIAIDLLNFDGTPFAKIFSPKFADANIEIAQVHALENAQGIKLAKAIVYGKIKNQLNTLKYFSRQRKNTSSDFVKTLTESCNKIKLCLSKLNNLQSDSLEVTRGKLLAIEGRAAMVYWEQIKVLVGNYINFQGRKHKGATDIFNSMLNYGYAILYSRVWEAIIAARLNPSIGYLHKASKLKPALVFDFVEEFRASIVDRTVVGLISKKEKMRVKNGLLSDYTKKRLAQKIFERINKIEKFRKQEIRVRDIIRGQATAMKQFLTGSITNYKPYIKTW